MDEIVTKVEIYVFWSDWKTIENTIKTHYQFQWSYWSERYFFYPLSMSVVFWKIKFKKKKTAFHSKNETSFFSYFFFFLHLLMFGEIQLRKSLSVFLRNSFILSGFLLRERNCSRETVSRSKWNIPLGNRPSARSGGMREKFYHRFNEKTPPSATSTLYDLNMLRSVVRVDRNSTDKNRTHFQKSKTNVIQEQIRSGQQ